MELAREAGTKHQVFQLLKLTEGYITSVDIFTKEDDRRTPGMTRGNPCFHDTLIYTRGFFDSKSSWDQWAKPLSLRILRDLMNNPGKKFDNFLDASRRK